MTSPKPCAFFVAFLALVALLGAGASYSSAATINVGNVSQLYGAVSSARSGDIISIAPGTYQLTSGLQMNFAGVTIQGSSGNRDDVLILGGGMNTNSVQEGILVNTDNISIKNLTLKGFYYNVIHIRAENDADNTVIDNVKTWNAGERHIKVSAGGGYYSDNVVIRNLYMYQDQALTAPHSNLNYIGGIDAMTLNNFTISGVLARGIHGSTPSDPQQGNAAVFLWNDCRNGVVERVQVYDSDKGIALGNPSSTNYATTNVTVRNNMIRRNNWNGGNSIGLELVNTRDAKIYNNTFYSDNAGYGRLLSIQDSASYPTTNLLLANNIFRGGALDLSTGNWSGADVAALGNIVDTTGATVVPTWFWDTAQANLHLTDTALGAIGHGGLLADVPTDFDGEGRPYGNIFDLGADEFRLRGDASLDLDVDFADYQLLETSFGKTTGATWIQGDFDYDRDVDFADYQLLEARFGTALDPASIPEPAGLSLLLLGALGLARRRR